MTKAKKAKVLKFAHIGPVRLASAGLGGGVTSLRIAKIAARGVRFPGALTPEEVRSVCGSVLTQAPDRVRAQAEAEADRA